MSNILIINGAKKFAHSNGQLNDTLTEVAESYLRDAGHDVKVVRAESIASGSAIATASTVVVQAMRNAFQRPSRRTGSRKTFATWKSVNPPSSSETNALATPSQIG